MRTASLTLNSLAYHLLDLLQPEPGIKEAIWNDVGRALTQPDSVICRPALAYLRQLVDSYPNVIALTKVVIDCAEQTCYRIIKKDGVTAFETTDYIDYTRAVKQGYALDTPKADLVTVFFEADKFPVDQDQARRLYKLYLLTH